MGLPLNPYSTPPSHRPGDGGRLENGSAPGHRVGEIFLGHQQRQERLARRMVERAHGAVQQQHRINRIDRSQAVQRERQQQQRAQGKRGQASLQDAQPREAVRGMPRRQEQEDARQKLRQPHQPQIQRPMRQPVHLPGHRHRLHLRSERRQEPGAHIVAVVGIAKSGAGLAHAGLVPVSHRWGRRAGRIILSGVVWPLSDRPVYLPSGTSFRVAR